MPEKIASVREAEVAHKSVLVRVDCNVPMEDGKILDDTRIRAILPTISLLRDRGAAKIMLVTHLGRPGGMVVEGLRTAPLFAHLQTLISTTGIELLENVRFNPGEEANDPAFAAELASHADVFVNDAFADSHRAHASIVGVPKLLPGYAGLLLEEEIKQLSQALAPPKHSLAIIGGAKSETKLPLIQKFAVLYGKVLVGGMLANEYTPTQSNVLLPVDGVPQREGMLDIGPATQSAWADEIKKAEFVLWNGTVGMYEKKEYAAGTEAVARALVDSHCRAVLGGGDTLAATKQFTFDPQRMFVSTGGGAMLQFLTDGTLPGIEALRR